MKIDTAGPREATLARPVFAGAFGSWPRPAMPSWFRRGAEALGDLLTLVVLVFSIPLAIVAIGTPIALCVQLVVWMIRML